MKEGWVAKKLSVVTTKIGSGATPLGGEKAYKQTGISLIRSLNVYDDGFREPKLARIDEEQAKRLSNVVVEPGDVLLNITGASVARCCLAPSEFLPARVNQHVSIIRPVKQKLDSAFLQYLLTSKIYKDRLLNTGEEGGSTRQAITKAQLQEFIIEFPESLPEQQRIVAILDEAFDGIATAKSNAEQNLRNARALFESHLDAVFRQRGEGWVEQPMGNLADFRNGINYTKDSKGAVVKIVGVRNFQNNFWVPLDDLDAVTIDGELSELDKLKQDDILAVRSNGNIALIGRCILTGKVSETISHSGFTIRIRLSTDKLFPRYLSHFMKSSDSRKRLTDGGIGTNIKSLNQGMLSALVIPFPSLLMQQILIEKIERLSEETQNLEAIYQHKLAALDELKQSLLHRAFNGEL